MISYGKQSIDQSDVDAVVGVLRSDFLTQGPMVDAFERAFAQKVGVKFAVAVNSGTAALHASMFALGIGPGDEVIVPPITFTATANCVLFVGATPVFADVTPSGHLDPNQAEQKITNKTKALIAVDYAGMPCDYEAILAICDRHGLSLICDACHALGATWNGKPVGSIGPLNNFSFHPVKHIATGEGGMVTTDNPALAEKMREFRTHGITKDAAKFMGLEQGADGGDRFQSSSFIPQRSSLSEQGAWYYEMHDLGYNYRMSDINAALGVSQLKKLDQFVARRREIAAKYYEALRGIPHLKLPVSDMHPGGECHVSISSFHLFPALIDYKALGKSRTQVMTELRSRGIGTQVHYIPVCLQPYYRRRLGTAAGQFPAAEHFYQRELSIPVYPAMSDEDIQTVIDGLHEVMG